MMPDNKGFWRLTIKDNFSSAHALRNYEGKCENIHGHNFTAEIVVQGNTLDPKTEILLDYKVLKTLLKETLDTIDHTFLNDKAPFTTINPSSENLARYVWQAMEERLQQYPVTMYAVSISEKDGQTATYMENL